MAYREHNRLSRELQGAEADRRRAEDRAAMRSTIWKSWRGLGRRSEASGRISSVYRSWRPNSKDSKKTAAVGAARAEQARTLQAQKRVAGIESEVWDTLESLDDEESDEEPVPGWADLFELDGRALLFRAGEVLGNAAEGLTAAEERYGELREAASGHEELGLLSKESNEAAERHEAAIAEARRLAEELDDVSGGEDLEKREQGLREEAKKLRELAANHRGRANANEREAKNVEKAREAIVSGAEDHCPTCHRGFESGEQERSPTPCIVRRRPSGVWPPATPRRPASSPAPPTPRSRRSRRSRPRSAAGGRSNSHSSAPRTAPPRGSKP